MLKTAGFTLPTKVHIHGFLNVAGEKMVSPKGRSSKPRPICNISISFFCAHYLPAS
ncbi:MAG: hypothetical protein R3C56_34625 [Pirellulaceae bacterium]